MYDNKNIYERISHALKFQFNIRKHIYIVKKVKRFSINMSVVETFEIENLSLDIYYDFKLNKFRELRLDDWRNFQTNDIFKCFETLERIK